MFQTNCDVKPDWLVSIDLENFKRKTCTKMIFNSTERAKKKMPNWKERYWSQNKIPKLVNLFHSNGTSEWNNECVFFLLFSSQLHFSFLYLSLFSCHNQVLFELRLMFNRAKHISTYCSSRSIPSMRIIFVLFRIKKTRRWKKTHTKSRKKRHSKPSKEKKRIRLGK